MENLNDSLFRQSVKDAACQFQTPLIRYAKRMLGGDESTARDVVQQAFLKLCSVPAESRPERVDRWLYRVCHNQAIDWLRKNHRTQTGQERAVEQLLDPGLTHPQQHDEQELAALMRDQLLTLPDSQREAIDLWAHGFRYLEIAEIMDRREASIRVLVHRGITKLRNSPLIRRWLDLDPQELVPLPSDATSTNAQGKI